MSDTIDRAILFYICFIAVYLGVIAVYSPLYAASTHASPTINTTYSGNWSNGTTPSIDINPFDFFDSFATFTTDYWLFNMIVLFPLPILLIWAAIQYVRGV